MRERTRERERERGGFENSEEDHYHPGICSLTSITHLSLSPSHPFTFFNLKREGLKVQKKVRGTDYKWSFERNWKKDLMDKRPNG